jgi:hypothetical protein
MSALDAEATVKLSDVHGYNVNNYTELSSTSSSNSSSDKNPRQHALT